MTRAHQIVAMVKGTTHPPSTSKIWLNSRTCLLRVDTLMTFEVTTERLTRWQRTRRWVGRNAEGLYLLACAPIFMLLAWWQVQQ